MLNLTLLSTIHLIGVALLFIAFVIGGISLFQSAVAVNQQPSFKFRKLLIAIQHSALTLLIITGIALLYANNFHVETWFYAKVILFFVMLSSLIKAYKKDGKILLAQRRAGWGIALVVFIAIYMLVILQPTFA